ncbi:Replication initiation and membrane attachment protein [Bacillus coahuilensis m2-6]|uniref:replication initiation and membrane attachment family protein n=1 Tax=Bacillus coahuilensis TaxID=408580 RepID=UPI0007506CCC|nr:replication initiation and membrane attachment family protein [Bacillus coahuilensis]KUP06637.1 Replication initiation and membrane attachment protein [Bacillus coahuilensis m2-6]
MSSLWSELQPVDAYQVKLKGILHEYHRQVLTFLYQPLIGPQAYSLYMTWWSSFEKEISGTPDRYNHYYLMDVFSLNLREILEARLKLEGIGLIKSYVKKTDDERAFVYELQPPLSPEQFFQDGFLNIFLYKKIGRTQFLKLKEFFSVEELDASQFTDITRSFQDVFTSDYRIVDNPEALEASEPMQGKKVKRGKKSEDIKLDSLQFDFEFFISLLSESMVPRKAITEKVKDVILKIAFLYGFPPIQMKKVLLQAMTIENEIDIEQLRKAARNTYQLQTGEEFPTLLSKMSEPVENSSDTKVPVTKEEKLIHYLNEATPIELLKDLSDGAEPSKSDMKIIEGVLLYQKLPQPVVNVLIYYVLLRTDMKLTKGYVDKIASHWSRKKIATVEEAMAIAKKEHAQYIEWTATKDKPSATRRKSPIRTEKLPDWFTQAPKEESGQTEEESFDFENERRKLEEELRKRGEVNEKN